MENEKRRAEDAERPAGPLNWGNTQPGINYDRRDPATLAAPAVDGPTIGEPAGLPVDAAELGKLKALAEAATPGPWHAPGMGEIHMETHDSVAQICFKHDLADDDEKFGTEADAQFIAAANPAAILRIAALVAQLEAENDRLREALGDKVMAQTMLHELSIQDGGINMRYSGGAAQLLAEAFGEQFESSGATNYLEVGFNTSNGVRLLVTLQRCDGKTPATLKTEAEALVAQQAARIAELDANAERDKSLILKMDEAMQSAWIYVKDTTTGEMFEAFRPATQEGK